MSSKQDKIKKMLAMQKKFIELDRARGVSAEEYFMPKDGAELNGYREEYSKLAMDVVEDAHKEKGSHA
jgi:hypothetical protein